MLAIVNNPAKTMVIRISFRASVLIFFGKPMSGIPRS